MNVLNASEIKNIFREILKLMEENRDYLVELDAKAGDGDLGISMCHGFSAICKGIEGIGDIQLKKLLMKISMILNEASPSTLGTILAVGIMGGAKSLKGKTEISIQEAADFFDAGIKAIMKRAGSKRGEKTILDSLGPGSDSLRESAKVGEDLTIAAKKAYEAAHQGMLDTKNMKAVHGRAAYYAETSIGKQDGGATVGMLIFKGIYNYLR